MKNNFIDFSKATIIPASCIYNSRAAPACWKMTLSLRPSLSSGIPDSTTRIRMHPTISLLSTVPWAFAWKNRQSLQKIQTGKYKTFKVLKKKMRWLFGDIKPCEIGWGMVGKMSPFSHYFAWLGVSKLPMRKIKSLVFFRFMFKNDTKINEFQEIYHSEIAYRAILKSQTKRMSSRQCYYKNRISILEISKVFS